MACTLLIVMPWVALHGAAAESASTGSGARAPVSDVSTEDIRDIRGPKAIAPAWLVPVSIAAAIALALGAYAYWRWRRRLRAVRPLLAFEVALQRLEQIRSLMRPAEVREFSIAITDIIRSYIEERFQVTATHRTTEEFLHDLLRSSEATLASHRELLAEFLQQCDLAKFAGMSLSQQIMESLHASARSFVIETANPLLATEDASAALSST
jgi:Domain of unknown function (DUF4381)